jgi:hypothetical protein
MTSTSSLRQQIELNFVKGDACLYFEVMVKLSKQKRAPVLFPGLAPYRDIRQKSDSPQGAWFLHVACSCGAVRLIIRPLGDLSILLFVCH